MCSWTKINLTYVSEIVLDIEQQLDALLIVEELQGAFKLCSTDSFEFKEDMVKYISA